MCKPIVKNQENSSLKGMNASLLSAEANILTHYKYRGEILETMVKDRHRYGELDL